MQYKIRGEKTKDLQAKEVRLERWGGSIAVVVGNWHVLELTAQGRILRTEGVPKCSGMEISAHGKVLLAD